MKTSIFIALFFLGVVFSVKASLLCEADSASDIRIEQQQIICHQSVVGRLKTSSTKSANPNAQSFRIQIFEDKGRLVAEYDIELLGKRKKNQDAILGAKIKTLRDNVVHNGTNFLDFHAKEVDKSQDSLFQLEKVVEYLMAYDYL